MAKAGSKLRKRPRQERSRELAQTILSAAAALLADEGFAAATTNRIARRAGVSVGSLYQYFADRDAIVAALIEGEAQRLTAALELVAARADLPPARHLRAFVAAAYAERSASPALHRVLSEQAPRLASRSSVHPMLERQRAAARAILARHAASLRVVDLDFTAFVVLETVSWLTHSMIARHQGIGSESAVIEEIAAMVTRFLMPV